MEKLALLLILALSGCTIALAGIKNNDNASRALMCKKRCGENHHNITLIRVTGKTENWKINIVSIEDRTVCECKF